jgi:hypothetical protein
VHRVVQRDAAFGVARRDLGRRVAEAVAVARLHQRHAWRHHIEKGRRRRAAAAVVRHQQHVGAQRRRRVAREAQLLLGLQIAGQQRAPAVRDGDREHAAQSVRPFRRRAPR